MYLSIFTLGGHLPHDDAAVNILSCACLLVCILCICDSTSRYFQTYSEIFGLQAEPISSQDCK